MTRGDLKFTAPLTGITAAVVGVILNLAVFFAYHVLSPQGLGATFEWFSALMGLAASVALFGYNVGIIAKEGDEADDRGDRQDPAREKHADSATYQRQR